MKSRILSAKYLLFPASFLFVQTSFAQSDSATKPHPSVKFDVNFLSNNVYLGRKDSATLSYLTPGVLYRAPSGFFASAALSFLTQESRMDLATLEAGYDYYQGSFEAGLSGSNYFYKAQSENVKATLSASLDAYLTYETPYVTPVLSGSISFGSNQPDYFAGLGLEHSFYAIADALTVTPSFTANGSTQNFYNGYYTLRKNNGKRKQPGGGFTITQEALGASAFRILDYEASVDLSYKVKKFSFYVSPVYVVATNPNVIVTKAYRPNGTLLSSQSETESLSNSFYCTVGMSWRLR